MSVTLDFIPETSNPSNWLQIATLLTSIFVPILVASFGYWQYVKSFKNKIYEKRLSTIYAPAYSYLVKQEKVRELLGFSDELWDLNNYPILSLTSTIQKQTINSEGVNVTSSKSNGIVHTDYVLNLINEFILPNAEYAPSNLLNAANAYIVVLEYEKRYQSDFGDNPIFSDILKTLHNKIPSTLTKSNELQKEIKKLVEQNIVDKKALQANFIIYFNATYQKVSIENDLISEITSGYKLCLTKLNLIDSASKKNILKWPNKKH